MSKKATGIRLLHYAPLTLDGDTYTFGTPKRLKDVEEVTAQDTIVEGSNYADNMQNIYVSKISGATLTLAISNLDPEAEADITGCSYNLGEIETKSSDLPNAVAILYQKTYSDGSYANIIYYNCSLRRQDSNGKTEGENIEFTGDALTGKASPLPDEKIKYVIYSDKVGNNTELQKKLVNFFKEVQFISDITTNGESENQTTP